MKKIINRIKRISTLLRLDEDYSKESAAEDLHELENDLDNEVAKKVIADFINIVGKEAHFYKDGKIIKKEALKFSD